MTSDPSTSHYPRLINRLTVSYERGVSYDRGNEIQYNDRHHILAPPTDLDVLNHVGRVIRRLIAILLGMRMSGGHAVLASLSLIARPRSEMV